MAVTMTIRV